MRPLKLVVSAFGPYADKEVLELDKLGKRGLYLITGATGSGKTSIFDAITYALYDRASGSTRGDSDLRSKYAQPTVETFVELVFSCNEKVYKIKRNPEYTRPKTRGEGFTKQTARVELIMPDGRVVDKSKDVDREIKDIIGIDYGQFMQIAMIAQGDFREVLNADTNKRQKIFRHIFKTEKYERLQNAVKEQTSKLRAEYDRKTQTLKTYAGTITCAEESEFLSECKAIIDGENLSVQNVVSTLKSVIEEDNNEFARLEEKINAEEKELGKLNETVGKAEELEKSRQELAQKRQRLADFTSECAVAQTRLDEAKSNQPEQKKHEKSIAVIEINLKEYDALEAQKGEIKLIDMRLEKLEANKKLTAFTVSEKKNLITSLKKVIADTESASADKQKLESDKLSVRQRGESVKGLQDELVDFVTLSQSYSIVQTEYTKAKDEWTRLSEDHAKLFVQFLDGQAGIMATTLKVGEPCPVCGAREHPHPAVSQGQAPTEESLKKAKQSADEASDKTKALSEKCAEIEGRLNAKREGAELKMRELWGEILSIEKAMERAKEERQSLLGKYKSIEGAIVEVANRLKAREKANENLPIEEKHLEQLNQNLADVEAEILKFLTAKEERQNQVDNLKSKLEFEGADEANKKLTELYNSVEKIKKAVENAENSLKEKKEHLIKTQGEIDAIEKLLSDSGEYDLENGRAQKVQLLEKIKALRDRMQAVITRCKTNGDCLNNILKTSQQASEIEEHLKWMTTLSDTANGVLSGKEKTTFETYVQMRFFDRILQRASDRLYRMTSGQYELIRRDKATTHRSQVGLDIDVLDHDNGSQRPAGTLSGGQQFLASLALALGLSDEIQSISGGVKLDTMFVDEGFGSLDDETLKKAISVLYELSDGNRLVGIISHVGELKEKIDKQIVITKEIGKGSKCRIQV